MMKSEKGSILIYTLIIISIILPIIYLLFGLTIREHQIALYEEVYSYKKHTLESVQEKTLYQATKFVEDVSINTYNLIQEKIKEGEFSEEDINNMYQFELEKAISKKIIVREKNGSVRYIRTDVAMLEGYSTKYSIDNENIEIKSIDVLKDHRLEKNYKIKYTLRDNEFEKVYNAYPINILMRYPEYEEINSNNYKAIPVEKFASIY